MEINKLIKQPESKVLEFKSDLSSLDPILKTIVAFANTAGGTLLIGLSPQGEILGIENVFKAEKKLANAIADSIHPSMLPEIEISTLNSKNILIVKVSYWKGPFYLKKLGTPNGVYVRLGSTSRPAGPELLTEMQRTLLQPSFDEQPLTELSLDSLELEKAKEAFHQVAIFNNRLEIQNPGMLPFGFTLEDLKGGVSRVRNRVIARVFNELDLMEEWGSGYKRITEACATGGYPEASWMELGTSFRVIFYPHSATSLEVRSPKSDIQNLSPKQLSILNTFTLGENLSFRQILEKLPFSIPERSLRHDRVL